MIEQKVEVELALMWADALCGMDPLLVVGLTSWFKANTTSSALLPGSG